MYEVEIYKWKIKLNINRSDGNILLYFNKNEDKMKKLLLLGLMLTTMNVFAETTYYSDGSYSQTSSNGNGGSTTYNSDGSYSQSSNSGSVSTTYNSDGTYSSGYN